MRRLGRFGGRRVLGGVLGVDRRRGRAVGGGLGGAFVGAGGAGRGGLGRALAWLAAIWALVVAFSSPAWAAPWSRAACSWAWVLLLLIRKMTPTMAMTATRAAIHQPAVFAPRVT